jgi:hypothetical protein
MSCTLDRAPKALPWPSLLRMTATNSPSSQKIKKALGLLWGCQSLANCFAN